MTALVALPIILPGVGAALTLAFRNRLLQRFITMLTLISLIALSVSLVIIVDQSGVLSLQIGGWDTSVP